MLPVHQIHNNNTVVRLNLKALLRSAQSFFYEELLRSATATKRCESNNPVHVYKVIRLSFEGARIVDSSGETIDV